MIPPTAWTASDWVLVIGAIFAGFVLLLNTWATHFGRKEAKAAAVVAAVERQDASEKLDQIHDLTNSNMTALKAQLAASLDRIARLEQLLEKRVP